MKNYQFSLTETQYKQLLPLTDQLRAKTQMSIATKKMDYITYYFIGTYAQYNELKKQFK
jgi:radical SAM superfamily enzyme